MLQTIQAQLQPYHAQLIAVSKTKPDEAIMALYTLGQRAFGENYVQELVDKATTLPQDIEWHFIGHLQSNKVKYIAPFVHLIHTLDSISLLQEIEKQAIKHNRSIDCLLQIKINQEDTKFGIDTDAIDDFMHNIIAQNITHVRIVGVMGMATFTDDLQQVRKEFKQLKAVFTHLQTTYFSNNEAFKHISMGMSSDYTIALEEGSNMVRIGSLLFGERH